MSAFKMDWQHWLYAVIAAFIGGGAGAVVTAGTAMAKFPDMVNLNGGLHNFWQLFYFSFLVHGGIAVMLYLQKSPLPTIEDSTVNVKKTESLPGQPPKTTETIVESHTESK